MCLLWQIHVFASRSQTAKVELNEDIWFNNSHFFLHHFEVIPQVYFISFFIVLHSVFGTTTTNRYMLCDEKPSLFRDVFQATTWRNENFATRKKSWNIVYNFILIVVIRRKKPPRNWRWKSICSFFFLSRKFYMSINNSFIVCVGMGVWYWMKDEHLQQTWRAILPFFPMIWHKKWPCESFLFGN